MLTKAKEDSNIATTIFFAGRVISIPGSYSVVDASGLETIGLGASGIIALVGEAEGGIPASSITTLDEYISMTKPEQKNQNFRSGPLLEATGMAFEPSNDEDILAGAQRVIAMKVNPATQSEATLVNAQGDAIDLTSEDYGAFTEQINIAIGTGTNKGKLVTIIFEDVTESQDDIGGDTMFNLTYSEAVNTLGWDTMTGQVDAGGVLQALGTRGQAGLDGDVGTQLPGADTIEIISTAAGDTTQTVTVYGLDAGGDPVKEVLSLNGIVAEVGTQSFLEVFGCKMDAVAVGTVSVDPSGAGADILTMAPAATTAGMILGVAMFVAGGKVTMLSSGASVKDVILEGTNLLGASVLEKVTLTGVVSVSSVGDYTKITGIIMGDVEAAQTVTWSASALLSTAATHTTLQQLADYANARTESGDGFTMVLGTGLTAFLNANLDISVSAVSIDAPADPDFLADIYAIVDWINTNSAYVTAALATGATGGAPTNTTTALFLSGGIEGVTTATHWQTALNLLKQVRVNTVVVLTGDSAIHAKQDAHCAYMGGIGRSERDCMAGIQNTAKDDVPTKTELKTQIISLNSRHTRALAQKIDRFNAAGVRTTFQSFYAGVIAAGMQAGSPVGTSLTHKSPDVLSFAQDTSWNPADDAEELIQAGLMFMENIDGTGRQWVRNITTHLSTNNLAYIEASVNEAANFAVFEFRGSMERSVGKKGFAGTKNAAKGVAIKKLGLLVDEEVLVQHRALNIEVVADVLEVSVEMAPVIPINFVKNNIHLVIAA